MSIKNNITSLQSLLEKVNALPEATDGENLDVEISTQENLLAEQDAKIAELAQVLTSKSGGNKSNFPYKITLATNEVGDLSNATICYGSDNNSVVVLTNFNMGKLYEASWDCMNCNMDRSGPYFSLIFGDIAIFTDFTGDATISIDWYSNGWEV